MEISEIQVQPKKSSSTKWITAAVLIAAAILALWAQVFTTIETVAQVAPQMLAPDGGSTAVIKLAAMNRLGYAVPFKRVPLRCECIEGGLLGTLSYNADSTEAYFRTGMQEGVVEVRIFGEPGSLPQSVKIYIEIPAA